MSETRPPVQGNPDQDANADLAPRVLVVDPSEMGGLLQALLARHQVEAHLCRTAGAALDAILAAPPDLAIVDLDLPDASGVDLLHILKQPPQDTPVILMASVPKDGLESNVQRGVELSDGFFQKPLHGRQLIERVKTLLGLTAHTRAMTPASGVSLPYSEDLGTLPPPVSTMADPFVPPGEEADSHRDVLSAEDLEEMSFEILAEELAEEMADDDAAPPPPALDAHEAQEGDEQPSLAPPPVPALLDEVTDPAHDFSGTVTTDPTHLLAMWMDKRQAAAAGDKPPPLPPQPENQGDLARTPLSNLLDAFFSAQQSGSINLTRGQARRRIQLRRGWVAAADSNLAPDQLEHHLCSTGQFSKDQVDQILQDTGLPRTRLAAALLQSGTLDRDALKAALVDLRWQVLSKTFAWTDGSYQLAFGNVPAVPLPALFPGNVILRGIMASFSLVQLRSKVPQHARYAPRTDGIYPLSSMTLDEDEARVVVAADGTKTVQDLLALSDMDEQRVLGVLFGLERLRLLRALPGGPERSASISFF